METSKQLPSDNEEADVDIIGELEDSNADASFSSNTNSSMARPEIPTGVSSTDVDSQKQIEDESLEVDVVSDSSLPKNPADSASSSFHAQQDHALNLDHLDQQPGPSGVNNENNCILDIDSDSDDSIKIIDVPKKLVPVITVLDSSDDEEIDVVQIIPKKTLKAKRCPEISPPKTIKEKLEEQREKLFPVKTEENLAGKSPPTKHDSMCSICLGNCENRAFLDQCFHSFCYTCIIQWANIVHTCPLCKTSFKSIIHDVQPDLQYKQNFMKEPTRPNAAELPDLISFESLFHSGQRFRYRTTMTAISNQMNDWHRQARYEASRNRRPSRSRWGRHSSSSHHMNASEERRRSIYRLGMVVKDIKHPPGRVRFRDTSLRFFKDNPAITHRLVPWILRDLKVILDNNGNDASFVLHLIMSLLVRYPLESNEFHTELQPFLLNDTRQFIRELISFASSPYDMRTYDSRVVYDMPSAVQAVGARNRKYKARGLKSTDRGLYVFLYNNKTDSTLTSSVLQRPSYTQPDREISFQDRLVDELFAGSRMEASPPLTRGSVSPEKDDILRHTGWNTDDSEIEITRVIHMMQVDNRTTTTNSSRNDRSHIARSRDLRNDIATCGNPRNDIAISRNQRNDLAISRNPRNDIAYVGKPKEDILVDCKNMATASSKRLLRRRVSKENNRHSYFTSGSSSSDDEKSRPGSESRRADTSKQKKSKSKRRRRSRSHSYSRRCSPQLTSRSNQDEPGYRDSHARSSSKTSDYLKGGRGLKRGQEALLDKERRGSSGPRSRSRDNHGSRSRSRHRLKSRCRTRSRSTSSDLLVRRVRGRTPSNRSRFDEKERFLGGYRHRSSSNALAKERNGMELCYSPDDRSGFSRNRDGKRKSRSPDTKLDYSKDNKNRKFGSSNVKSSHAKASEKQRRGKSGTPQEESFLEKLMKDAEQNESSSSSGKAGTYSRNHLVPSSRRSHELKEQPQFDLLCDAFESDNDENLTPKGSRSASKSSSSDYVKKHKKKKQKKKRGKEKKARRRNSTDIDIDTGSEISSDEEVLSNKNQRLILNDAAVSSVVCSFSGVVDCDSEKRSRSFCQREDHSDIDRLDITFTNKEESVKIGSDGSSVEIEEIKTRRKKKSKKQHKHRHKHKRSRKEQDIKNFTDLTENDRNDSDKESTRNFGHKPSDGAGAVHESDCQTVSLAVESSDSNRGEALKEDDNKYDATAESKDLNQSKSATVQSKHTTDILPDGITDSERSDRGDETIKDGRPVNDRTDDFGMQESNREIFEYRNETDVACMKMIDLKGTNSRSCIDEERSKLQKLVTKDLFISDVVIEDLDEKIVPRRMNESIDHSDKKARKCSGSNVSPEYEKQSLFSFPGPEEQNLNGDVNGLISSSDSKSRGKDDFGFEDLQRDITACSGNTAEKSFEIIQKDMKDALSDGGLETASSDYLSPHHQVNQINTEKEMGFGNIAQPEPSEGWITNPPYRRPRDIGLQEAEESGIKPVGETLVKINHANCQSESCKGIIDDRSSVNSDGLGTTRSLTQSLSVNTAVHKLESRTTQNSLLHSKEEDSFVCKSSLDGVASAMSEQHNINREPDSLSRGGAQPSDESFSKGRTVQGEREAIDLVGSSLLIDASLTSDPQKSGLSKQSICSLIPHFSQHQEDTSAKLLTLSTTNIVDLGASCLSPDARNAQLIYVNKQSTSSNDGLDEGDWQGTASERSIQSDGIETNQGVCCSLSAGCVSPTLEFIDKSNTSCRLGRQELEADSISTQSTCSERTETNLGAHRSLNTGSSSPILSNTCSSLRREEQEMDSS